MSATINDLLVRLHTEAGELGRALARQERPELDRLVAGWPELAQAAERALRALPVHPVAADKGLEAMLTVIAPVAHYDSAWRFAAQAEPFEPLQAMARAYGVIADLLHDEATLVLSSPAAADQLRRSLVEPVAIAADTTLAAWPDERQRVTQRWHLHWIRALTDPARFRHRAPTGPLGTIAAASPSGSGLDAAIAGWAGQSRKALMVDHGTSRIVFETTARSIVLLTAAAAIATRAAGETGVLEPRRAQVVADRLADANRAWQACAVWPRHVDLAGTPNPDLRDAARGLREHLDRAMRTGNHWATPAELFVRTQPDRLLGTLDHGLRAASEVGAVHYAALHHLVRGRGQLWVAARAVNPALADPTLLSDARRGRWIPMPRQHPDGPTMLWGVQRALEATRATRGTADQGSRTGSAPAASRSWLSPPVPLSRQATLNLKGVPTPAQNASR